MLCSVHHVHSLLQLLKPWRTSPPTGERCITTHLGTPSQPSPIQMEPSENAGTNDTNGGGTKGSSIGSSDLRNMLEIHDHGVNLIRILKEFNDAISKPSIDADGGTPKDYNPKRKEVIYIISTFQKWEGDQTLNISGQPQFRLILKSILPVDYVRSCNVSLKCEKYKQICDLSELKHVDPTGTSQATKELQKFLKSEIKTMVKLTRKVHKKIASARAQWNSSRVDALHETVNHLYSTLKETVEKIRDDVEQQGVHIVFHCKGLGGEQVCAHSMARLIPPICAEDRDRYLNDNIIGLYCRCLDKQNKEAVERGLLSKESTVVFWLTNNNVNKKCAREQNEAKMNTWWNKRNGEKKMTDFEFIYFPCVFDAHWTLYILNVSTKTVAHYCSMSDSADGTSLLPRYDELKRFFSAVFEGEQIEYVATEEQCPNQADAFNCGVHVLILIHYHMNRFELSSDFVHGFVNKFRYFILLCLYSQRHPEGSDEKTNKNTPIKQFTVRPRSRGTKAIIAAKKQMKAERKGKLRKRMKAEHKRKPRKR